MAAHTSVARGLAFRETMQGPFALGEADPARGALAGRAAGTTLTLHLRIAIPDMRAFAAEPSHSARLGADVLLPALGAPHHSTDGVVRLFSPAPGVPERREMYYGIRMTHGGRTLYLAGVKHVDGGSVFAMWPETTTLYTRLHDGPDEQASVIGAGVLKLGPLDLLRTLPSMRPTPGLAGLTALAHFGGFFVSELWNAYIARRPRHDRAGENVGPV
jgi:hypothetical protein